MAKHNNEQKKESEFEEKVLHINRCSKVVKGGRKFSFSALILVGNGKGKVGYGFAKANELTDAIKKAGENARKEMIDICMHEGTIPHEVLMKSDGAQVLIKPARPGTGVVAGSKTRAILELAGVRDVIAKNLGCSNPINQVKATFMALKKLMPKQKILESRGMA